MDENDTVDLRTIKEVFVAHKVRVLTIIFVCTLVAIAVAFMLPKEYESTTLLRAKSQKSNGISLQAASAIAMLGGNVASPTQAYMEMLKSRSVLDPIIAGLDLPEDKKEKVDAKSFAKDNLKILNTKGTDLVEVTAIGRTPEEAQQISIDVVKSFQQLLTKLNQSEQSLMVKFLNDRMTVAKKDMEQAEQNLEKFRQQKKIYVPDAQAKAGMEKVIGYDKRLAEQRVQNQAMQVKLQGINEQLAKQNAAISEYKLADNVAIQQIRSSIITKQMALVDLQQRYTDKHPTVALAKAEIDELKAKLQNEVANAVSAGTTSLNPVHAGLLTQKVATETELMVGESLVESLASVQAGAEQEMSKLSADGMTYIGLERQVNITREVYLVLVKSYEQTRIQETMESMDIQIVDEANLPQKPSAPKKILIAIIGGVLGVMLAFVYVVIAYSRGSKSAISRSY